MPVLFAALTALMLFATPVVAEGLGDAVAVSSAGDHQKAFRLFKPFAEQGNWLAQFGLAFMYDYECRPVADAFCDCDQRCKGTRSDGRSHEWGQEVRT